MPVELTAQASWPEQYAQLCDERDLYRALLLAEPQQLRHFLRQSHAQMESVQALLQQTARSRNDFRTRLAQLVRELHQIEILAGSLDLPSFRRRLDPLLERLDALRARGDATGDDLLPVLPMIDDFYCHLIAASDVRPLTTASEAADSAAHDAQAAPHGDAPADDRFGQALQQLAERAAAEHGREITLTTRGLDLIPDELFSSLFDIVSQLVRNAIEHGIELPEDRIALAKDRRGRLLVEVRLEGGHLHIGVHDDGRGLDAVGLRNAAVRCGLLDSEHPTHVSPRQVARLIFAPGVTTAADPQRAGLGMQGVREAIRRLGGRIEFATKLGHFTRFDVALPRH